MPGHDIRQPGPVIVIDPHGDLYDFCLKQVVSRGEFLALDFSSAAPPSVNPIYLDARNEQDVHRNIDELVQLFIRSSHHQFAGPRFADLMRLCFESLLAVSDEKTRWASIGDVTNLIEDVTYRTAVTRQLDGLGRADLSRRWKLHERMQQTQQAEVEQWFISKFADFRSSGAFQQSTSGKPDVSFRRALERGSVILVKIPRPILGDAATRFLGSLIVERVFRYTLEGIFSSSAVPASMIVDEFQHFVGSSFERLVPEARKFNIGLTIANQTLSQLREFSAYEGARSDSLFQILMGNVGNLIIQGVGRQDARLLAPEVGVDEGDLLRIGRFSALAQLTVDWERGESFVVTMKDSSDYPSPVAEAVASSEATRMLERAGADVEMPRISRPESAEKSAGEGDDAAAPGQKAPAAAE